MLRRNGARVRGGVRLRVQRASRRRLDGRRVRAAQVHEQQRHGGGRHARTCARPGRAFAAVARRASGAPRWTGPAPARSRACPGSAASPAREAARPPPAGGRCSPRTSPKSRSARPRRDRPPAFRSPAACAAGVGHARAAEQVSERILSVNPLPQHGRGLVLGHGLGVDEGALQPFALDDRWRRACGRRRPSGRRPPVRVRVRSGVRRRSALSSRSCKRYSAREVNMR